MSDKHTEWLNTEMDGARGEWFAERMLNDVPEPTTTEQDAFRLGFAFGADAGLRRAAELLTREE